MEQTVEQKLEALWSLQTIHTKIDKIRQLRGELPIEVADLEDEIAGLETRLEKIRTELDDLEDSIVKRKNMIKDADAAIKKYESQLNEVKNNREYDAISKEIDQSKSQQSPLRHAVPGFRILCIAHRSGLARLPK